MKKAKKAGTPAASGKRAAAKKTTAPKAAKKPVKKAAAVATKAPAVKASSAKAAAPKRVASPAVKAARKPSPKVTLTAKHLEEFKALLIEMRQRLTGQIAALQGDSLQRQDAVNSEEDGTDAFERQFALNLASSENDLVFEIDEALQRLDQKSYGVCEQCTGGIEAARLKALPFVRLCIGCQTENEKGTRRFRPTPV